MIHVLAGVDGAGKSSIGGSALHAAGLDWYNPDDVAREMRTRYPDRPVKEIRSAVWNEGLGRLKTAILEDMHFAFETTLGGRTITHTLLDAIAAGVKVNVWYCGLRTPELHIKRVAARVARGGHDIPEETIRSRYKTSMVNLCRLAPGLHQLAVYDNSRPLNDQGLSGIRLLLHMVQGKLRMPDTDMPDWAKPIAAVCLTKANTDGIV